MKKQNRKSDTLNVLDFIGADSSMALDDVREVAASLVVRTGEEREPQWNDSAEAWIAGIAGCVVKYGEPGRRSLQTLRTLFSDPQKLQKAIELMCKSDAWEGMLARMGHGLTRYVDRELGSVLTTTNRHLRFLDTIAISESTGASTFDPAELRNGKMTVYLVLPPDHMRSQSALLRMWVGSMLRAVVKGGLQERNKVHFVLDEAASLGRMDCLEDAVDKYRGYGVRLLFFYQSISQLLKCWGEGGDQTLLSNTSQVFFGVNDLKTAEYVSSRLGEETITTNSGGRNVGKSVSDGQGSPGSTSFSDGWNTGWQEQARQLLKPDEVAQLPRSIALTFVAGMRPIMTRLIRYYEEPLTGPAAPGRYERVIELVKLSALCAALVVTGFMALAFVGQL